MRGIEGGNRDLAHVVADIKGLLVDDVVLTDVAVLSCSQEVLDACTLSSC